MYVLKSGGNNGDSHEILFTVGEKDLAVAHAEQWVANHYPNVGLYLRSASSVEKWLYRDGKKVVRQPGIVSEKEITRRVKASYTAFLRTQRHAA
jgi:hypothetical protein